MSDLVSGPRTPTQESFDFLVESARAVTDEDYKALLDIILEDEGFVARLKAAPAAKAVHHSYPGGLVEHTASMLRLCHTALELYDELDADLLVTSCILHDIGKMTEYNEEMVVERTTEGRLLGHIVLGLMVVDEYIRRLGSFPREKRMALMHVLVSHHGSLEWGSPQVPMTLEAVALHFIDNLDAKLNQFRQVIKTRKDPEFDGWTTYDKLLERYLYFGGSTRSQEDGED